MTSQKQADPNHLDVQLALQTHLKPLSQRSKHTHIPTQYMLYLFLNLEYPSK